MLDGLLLINKPKGWRAFDVIRYVRKIKYIQKIGHSGSLDPIAQGVMIICMGAYTKYVEKIMQLEKEYVVKIVLGERRDTDDIEGKILKKNNPPKEIDYKVLDKFKGKIIQNPPFYSAIKWKGKPLYKYARKGESVEIKKKEVEIYEIKPIYYKPPHLWLKVVCGRGTYIRALARDLGEELGCGGCVGELVRKRIGKFTIKDAIRIEKIKTWEELKRNVKKWK